MEFGLLSLPSETLELEIFSQVDLASLLSLSLASTATHRRFPPKVERFPGKNLIEAYKSHFNDPFLSRKLRPRAHLLLEACVSGHESLFRFLMNFFNFEEGLSFTESAYISAFCLCIGSLETYRWFTEAVRHWNLLTSDLVWAALGTLESPKPILEILAKVPNPEVRKEKVFNFIIPEALRRGHVEVLRSKELCDFRWGSVDWSLIKTYLFSALIPDTNISLVFLDTVVTLAYGAALNIVRKPFQDLDLGGNGSQRPSRPLPCFSLSNYKFIASSTSPGELYSLRANALLGWAEAGKSLEIEMAITEGWLEELRSETFTQDLVHLTLQGGHFELFKRFLKLEGPFDFELMPAALLGRNVALFEYLCQEHNGGDAIQSEDLIKLFEFPNNLEVMRFFIEAFGSVSADSVTDPRTLLEHLARPDIFMDVALSDLILANARNEYVRNANQIAQIFYNLCSQGRWRLLERAVVILKTNVPRIYIGYAITNEGHLRADINPHNFRCDVTWETDFVKKIRKAIDEGRSKKCKAIIEELLTHPGTASGALPRGQ